MTGPATVVNLDALRGLADRLEAASGSIRLARPLRADLLLAARIFDALLRSCTIVSSITLPAD
jgi:hypothetical protein